MRASQKHSGVTLYPSPPFPLSITRKNLTNPPIMIDYFQILQEGGDGIKKYS